MGRRMATGAFLLVSAFVVLSTCQLQFNKSTGNSLALSVVVPGGVSSGGKTIVAGARSLVNGASVTVTISQEGASFTTQQTVSLNGQASIDFSFSLTGNGVYDVLAVMQDSGGNTLAQSTTKLTVPAGDFPVVLTLTSPNLLNAVLADSLGNGISWTATFSPFTYSYNSFAFTTNLPLTLTLTTVDPGASISVTEIDGTNNYTDSPSGSMYTLHYTGSLTDTVTVVVTAQNATTQTYAFQLSAG
jgi:hypothetical protein